MPYIGNVINSFAVETGNINDQAVTAPKLSATGGTDGQVLALDAGGNLVWTSDPAGQWVTSGNDIYYNTGSVGIGTASPGAALHISNSVAEIRLTDSDGDGDYANIISGATGNLFLSADAGNGGANSFMSFLVDNSEKARIASSGSVGIGTVNPSGILNLDRPDLTTDTWLRVSQADTEVFSLSQPSTSEIRFATPDLSIDREFTFYTKGLERMRIDSSGRLLVGTSTSVDSNAKLQTYASSGTVLNHIESGSLANNTFAGCQIKAEGRIAQLAVYKHSGITNNCAFLYLQEEDGTNAYIWADNSGVLRISATSTHVGTTSGTVVGAQTSDERLKNILGPVEYGLETLKQLDPVRYSLKSEPETEKLGFIAQQVQPLIPQSVFDTNEHIEGEPEDAPTKLGMEYVALIPVLVNAIKELSAEVDALKAQLQVQ